MRKEISKKVKFLKTLRSWKRDNDMLSKSLYISVNRLQNFSPQTSEILKKGALREKKKLMTWMKRKE